MRMRSFNRGPDAGPSRRGRSPPKPPGRGPEPELKGGRRGGKLEIGESLGRSGRQCHQCVSPEVERRRRPRVRSGRAAHADCTRGAGAQANQGGFSTHERPTPGGKGGSAAGHFDRLFRGEVDTPVCVSP
jgi:hypothetical protein